MQHKKRTQAALSDPFSNHTAFKLYSLWHVNYLADVFYGFRVCFRVDFQYIILLAVPLSFSSKRHGFWAQCLPSLLFLASGHKT